MLEWRGDEVLTNLEKAAVKGLEKTAADCVKTAKGKLKYGRGLRTATLQGSIQMRAVERRGKVFSIVWGSYGVAYAIFVELGTAAHWIGSAVKMAGIGWRYIGQHPGTRPIPYLRPAADRHYGELTENIRRYL